MAKEKVDPVLIQVGNEQRQEHDTRKRIFAKLEQQLERPVVSLFTSFRYPVALVDQDADMLEGVLQEMDLSRGFALFISSPGGDGLAAERIINVCRSYSETAEYWAIVPGKAKSAATMVCLGASKVIMGVSSELGLVDPQVRIYKDGVERWSSAYNVVESYKDLFDKAVKETGNLQPYLQQLANYDQREIREFEAAIALSGDIAIRALSTGMMKGKSKNDIKKKIKIFLTPEQTKTHGRPIYSDEASKSDLKIEEIGVNDGLWELLYELYIRTNTYVSTTVAKCTENKEHSFAISPPRR